MQISYDGESYDYIQDTDGIFWVGNANSGAKYYKATTPSNGGGFITFSLNETTGVLTLVRDSNFNVYSTKIVQVSVKNLTTIDAPHRVKVFYRTNQPIEITEAAILDNENVPVVYASFPPFISESQYSHLSVGWFLNFVLTRLDGYHAYNEDVYNFNG